MGAFPIRYPRRHGITRAYSQQRCAVEGAVMRVRGPLLARDELQPCESLSPYWGHDALCPGDASVVCLGAASPVILLAQDRRASRAPTS